LGPVPRLAGGDRGDQPHREDDGGDREGREGVVGEPARDGGPTTAPRSAVIWKAATTAPPRPVTTSPTAALGATERNAAPQ
jgi:hypothetical protein